MCTTIFLKKYEPVPSPVPEISDRAVGAVPRSGSDFNRMPPADGRPLFINSAVPIQIQKDAVPVSGLLQHKDSAFKMIALDDLFFLQSFDQSLQRVLHLPLIRHSHPYQIGFRYFDDQGAAAGLAAFA